MVTYADAVAKKRGRGRPKHAEDPPVLFATTIPKSVHLALKHAKATTGKKFSEILTEALLEYAKRHRV